MIHIFKFMFTLTKTLDTTKTLSNEGNKNYITKLKKQEIGPGQILFQI